MNERPESESTALPFVLGLFLFVSPLTGWWTSLALPWYAIFLLWAAVIALAAWSARRRGRS